MALVGLDGAGAPLEPLTSSLSVPGRDVAGGWRLAKDRLQQAALASRCEASLLSLLLSSPRQPSLGYEPNDVRLGRLRRLGASR